jgi:uncharacterized protein YdeI (BOF family)
MKKILMGVLALLIVASVATFIGCGSGNDKNAATTGGAGGKLYGETKPSDAVKSTTAEVAKNPTDKRTFELSGKITELCQHSGCWLYLTDDTGRIYVTLLNFALPKDKINAGITVWGNVATTDKGEVKFVATGAEVR